MVNLIQNSITGYKAEPVSRLNAAAVSAGFSDLLAAAPQKTNMDLYFERASEAYDVPVSLLKAIGKVESGFDASAVSPCGARGVMQLMPSTADYLGVRDSFDPEQNIMGGAKYIAQMLDMYNGDVKLALAAYNAGAGNVEKYGGIPPFQETQAYVTMVLEYMDSGELSTLNAKYGDSGTQQTQSSYSNFTLGDYENFIVKFKDDLSFMLLSKILEKTSKSDDDNNPTGIV